MAFQIDSTPTCLLGGSSGHGYRWTPCSIGSTSHRTVCACRRQCLGHVVAAAEVSVRSVVPRRAVSQSAASPDRTPTAHQAVRGHKRQGFVQVARGRRRRRQRRTRRRRQGRQRRSRRHQPLQSHGRRRPSHTPKQDSRRRGHVHRQSRRRRRRRRR